MILNNTILNALNYGIKLDASDDNVIRKNNLRKNSYCIFIESGKNNSIIDNNISNSEYGIFLDSRNNNLLNNYISKNNIGICLQHSSINTLKYNFISNNQWGLHIDHSSGNDIINNTILENKDYGIYVEYSNGNTIYYNRIFNNSNQIFSSNATNIWYNENRKGNYWSDYTGIDTNGDGVGDTFLPHHGVDYYPLVKSNDINNKVNNRINEVNISSILWFFGSLLMLVIYIFLILNFWKRRKNRIKTANKIDENEDHKKKA
jgi:parallel beta-helix repeat protein